MFAVTAVTYLSDRVKTYQNLHGLYVVERLLYFVESFLKTHRDFFFPIIGFA